MTNEAPHSTRTPIWAWIVIVLISTLQPAAHIVCKYFPPEGMVSTGLHIPDSALFIQSMRMFSNSFYSPYASVLSDAGPNSMQHYAIPHLWFYGLQGVVADLLRFDHFMFYGLVNGLASGLFAWTAYRLFRTVDTKAAGYAFVILILGGGLGGILWILTGLAGVHDAPRFEDYFWRFGIYELIEGAHLFPATYYARSYYTVSLAGCMGAMTVYLHAIEMRCPRHAVLAGIVLLPAAFLNARYGVFTLGIIAMAALQPRDVPAAMRWRYAAITAVAGIIGAMLSRALMKTSPHIIQNHLDIGNMHMHFSPFIVSLILVAPAAAYGIWINRRTGSVIFRALIGAGLGYLAAYTVLFIGYQLWMGNILIARDTAVAITISDWALIGGIAGAIVALARKTTHPDASSRGTSKASDMAISPLHARSTPCAWVVVCLLGFTCLAISAFGQGWFLKFGPQRLTPLIYIFMCLIAGMALARVAESRPAMVQRYLGVVATCGVMSVLVSIFVFQSSIGWRGHDAPFAATHVSAMREEDRQMIDDLEEKRIIAAGPIADVIALQRGLPVFHGIASFNMSDQRFIATRALQEMFFNPDTSSEARHAIVDTFGIERIVCSATWPAADETIAALEADERFTRMHYPEGTAVFGLAASGYSTYQSAEELLDAIVGDAP